MDRRKTFLALGAIQLFVESPNSKIYLDIPAHLEYITSGSVSKEEFEELFKMNIGEMVRHFNTLE